MPDSQNTLDLVESIKRTLRLLVIATIVLYLLTIAAAAYVFFESRTNHDALCTFRQELQDQVTASDKFLAEHPKGFDGIPAITIRTGVEKQELAIESLNSLSC